MQGTERVEVTSAALLSFLQAEQDETWELVALERHDPGKHNQKTHGDWAHPGGASSSSSSTSSKSSSSPSTSSSSPAQHMSATLASKAAFYQGLASHPLSKTWTAQDQQLAAQMAKDFQAISDGLKSGKDVTSLVADMTKAAQSLHDAAPTHMTQARLDVMTGMQKRITHALSQHAASSSSSSSGNSSHGGSSSGSSSGKSGSSSSTSGHGSSSSGTSSSGHSGSSGSSSKGHTSSSSGHHSGSSTSGSSHHSGSSGTSGSGHTSSGSSSHHSGASSSHGSSHSSHGSSSSGHSLSGHGSSSSGGSGHTSGGTKGSGGSSSSGSGSSQGGTSSGGSSTASPQAQHMSSVLADKASFYSDLASKAVGKNWTAQDQQIASQMAQDMQSISAGLKSGKDVSAQIADMVKSAQALHDASPSHMTETKLDVMTGLQKRIGNTLNSQHARAMNADEAFERRDYSQSERDNMDDSDFGDPENQAFPIKTAQDVINASERLHNAKGDQEAIKARIKRLAKRKGFPLPQTWIEEEKQSGSDTKERSMSKNGNHAPFTGTHTHPHPAFGAQGDDEMHSHEHSHDNDADHGHSHDDDPQDRAVGALTSQDFSLYLPITRTDAKERRVFGQATIEQPDAYGTIFGFYPEAWKTWRGNIREQHDPKKAVGKALEVLPDEQRRAIDVDLKVSRGAQDTWLKVEDGVLTGLSASIIPDEEYGNDIRKWPKKEYNGKQYPYLPRYSVVELSLVDNPATPGCNIQIVRALDGASLATDVLDNSDEPITPETPTAQPHERAGASISAANRTKLHAMRDSAMQMCADNGCEECKGMMAGGDDGDGDNDTAERMLAVLERSLAPVYSRQQQFLARLAQYDTRYETIQAYLTDLQSHMGLLSERLANSNSPVLERVLADLSAVKVEVERIAAQPMPGGPILNGARPVDKTLATTPQNYNPNAGNYTDVQAGLRQMQQSGELDTQMKQLAAAALTLRGQMQSR